MWLTLDASGLMTRAALVHEGVVLALAEDDGIEGRPARMATLVAAMWQRGGVAGLAVIIGPGSFTGLRAALALMRGLSDASGVPAVGVTAGEAMFAADPAIRCVATFAGPGRVMMERGFPDATTTLCETVPTGASAAAPTASGTARAAAFRAAGAWPPRTLLPLYATPPAAVARAARPQPA